MNGERPAAARDWAIVGGVYLALVLIAAVWLWIDRQPPEWDVTVGRIDITPEAIRITARP